MLFDQTIINSYFGRYMGSPTGEAKSTVAKILFVISGVAAILNSVFLFATGNPLGTFIGILPNLHLGALSVVLGILALFGGLGILFFGYYLELKKFTLVSSILALLSICGLALLALIGSFLLKR